MWTVYTKAKKCLLFKSIYLYNDFVYFLEEQLHKDSKLGIMTMRVKGGYQKSSLQTFSKWVMHVHSFGRYIMIARCMKNVYLLNSSL